MVISAMDKKIRQGGREKRDKDFISAGHWEMTSDQRPKGWGLVLKIFLKAEDSGVLKQEKGDQYDQVEWFWGKVLEEELHQDDQIVEGLQGPQVFGFYPKWDMKRLEGFDHWSDKIDLLIKGPLLLI